jgi:hypothetical protein
MLGQEKSLINNSTSDETPLALPKRFATTRLWEHNKFTQIAHKVVKLKHLLSEAFAKTNKI